MHPPIPRDCPVLVIEGIPGAGKTCLQEQLRHQADGRTVHVYPEEALLFHWMHTWIPGISGLRLQLLGQVIAHIEATLAIDADALFVLTRFHLSYLLLGGNGNGGGDEPEYRHLLQRLAALGAIVWVPIVPDSAIAARASHPERIDPLWRAHLLRRLDTGGFPDIATMYRRYQQELQSLLERQPVRYQLLQVDTDDSFA